jgi:hypothetical protein
MRERSMATKPLHITRAPEAAAGIEIRHRGGHTNQ